LRSIQNNEGIFVTQEASYWVAAHLTGIFQIKDDNPDILKRGSRGAGVSIARGVRTSVKRVISSSIKYYFNGIEIEANKALVSSKVVEILIPEPDRNNIQVNHEFEIPLSAGYGASAAGAVGTAFCLNELFELELTDLEIFQVAHKAEVVTKSGLGDVIGLYQGGLELRLKAGAPGYGKTTSIEDSGSWNIATVHLGSLTTSSVLSDPQKRQAVNRAGEKILSDLISDPSFDKFILSAKEFTEKVGLWSKRLKKYLDQLPNGIIGAQIMLGESFFLFYHDKKEIELVSIPQTMIAEENICQNTVVKC
jgi:pantoate kinase